MAWPAVALPLSVQVAASKVKPAGAAGEMVQAVNSVTSGRMLTVS